MPQKSPVYAVTRIRVHEKDMVKPERMARMAEASPAEVMRALGDMGYGGISDPQLSDGDRMIAKELSDAYALINEVTFSPEQTDLFILKGDANNLKLLIKQRLTGTADSPALMKGVYPKDDIIRMVHNADYRELPEEFTKRLNALEQSFSGEIDPGRISTEIDRAYLEHCLNNAKGASLEYFKGLADFTNLLTMLRMRNMGAGADKLKNSLMPEGYVSHRLLIQCFDGPEEGIARAAATGPARESILKGLEEYGRSGRLTELERQRDNYLISLFKGAKLAEGGIEPLIGYLIGREQEAKCLRLIITAKRNNLPDKVITERLGELYG